MFAHIVVDAGSGVAPARSTTGQFSWSYNTGHDRLVRMPHCYFLFPSHEGLVPNPFPINDPLFRMSQFAIRVLRGSAEDGGQSPGMDAEVATPEPSESDPVPGEKRNHEALYKQWRRKAYWVSLEACSIAFAELVSRTLISEPPSETHWDFSAFEAAHRALAVVFYIHYEALRSRPYYGWKKEMEALLTDWLAVAKDIWRSRVLDPECHDLMQPPREDHWNVPQAATFLQEQLWIYPPDMREPPPDLEETLSHPANFGALYSDEIKLWIEGAFRRFTDEQQIADVDKPEAAGEVASASEGRPRVAAPATSTPPRENTKALRSKYRFQIALSFPGEARARVQHVAELLGHSIPKETILYDRWLTSELARPNLDVYLTELYKKDSLLLVFFLSGDYARKEWCGLEWRIMRDLVKQKQEHRLMPLRLDDSEILGFHSIDGYLDIRDLSDTEVANAILERLASLTEARFSRPPISEPGETPDEEIPDAPEYWQQRRLLGPSPVLEKIQQRPRWCIWVRPTDFKRARFRDLEQCRRFMCSFASRGRLRYPRFAEDKVEQGTDWVACETEDNGKHHSYLERWVLFRSAQFVQNLALDDQAQLGERTHVLEVLDRVTVAFEFAAVLAKEGVLPGKAAVTFSFFDVDGRQLTWPKDNFGDENHVDSDSWSEDREFAIRRIVKADRLAAEARSFALNAAMVIYSAFRWYRPPKALLKSEQARRFGPVAL